MRLKHVAMSALFVLSVACAAPASASAEYISAAQRATPGGHRLPAPRR